MENIDIERWVVLGLIGAMCIGCASYLIREFWRAIKRIYLRLKNVPLPRLPKLNTTGWAAVVVVAIIAVGGGLYGFREATRTARECVIDGMGDAHTVDGYRLLVYQCNSRYPRELAPLPRSHSQSRSRSRAYSYLYR